MQNPSETIPKLASAAPSREEFWASFVDAAEVARLAEVGVYRGQFAEMLLRRRPAISRYYLVDPWAYLDQWNKPFNTADQKFEEFYQETLRRTEFAADRRTVLRGTTASVAGKISDGELDYAYIDGDHTLRGVSIDLMAMWPKIRDGGWLGGDDFCPSIWQHDTRFEPTLVFPFAVYFAEAVHAPIYALPHAQFVIEKRAGAEFRFVDLTGQYGDLSLLAQIRNAGERSLVSRVVRKIRRAVGG